MNKTISKGIFFFALFFASIIIGISCQKEISGDTPDIPSVTQSTSVEGRVTDEEGMPVFGAAVKAGINSTQTDRNGMFKIVNAAFTTTETFVTVSKSGYFKGTRTFFSRINSNNFIKIQLLRKSITDRISASSGGDIEMRASKGSIHFEPNSFVTSNGTAYNGTVHVATQYLDPTLPAVADQMPGDLRGTSTTGNVVGLKSFGMIGVEIMDEAGQPIKIKNGSNATITVVIPAAKMSTAPATIPLWYFNDSTGLWKQEGSAVKTGDSYTGDVSHFSFWNCDDPYEYVKIEARIVNNAGAAVSAAKVEITDASGNSAYDYTDNNGYVDGYVPKNAPLTLEVLNACGQAAYSANIGPFAAQTNLGNITITQNTISIQGTAINCSGGSVTDGYVQILLNGATEFAGITNGAFSYTFINCQASSIAQLIAVDNSTLKQGNPVNVNISGSNINAGQLTACGISSATFFNLTIGGVNLTANTSEFYRQGWKETYDSNSVEASYVYAAYDSLANKFLYIGFDYASNHIFTVPSSINGNYLGMGYAGMNGSDDQIELEPSNPAIPVNFTEYGNLGQFIAGNYNGQVIRSKYDSMGNYTLIDTVNASFNFRVRHTTNPF